MTAKREYQIPSDEKTENSRSSRLKEERGFSIPARSYPGLPLGGTSCKIFRKVRFRAKMLAVSTSHYMAADPFVGILGIVEFYDTATQEPTVGVAWIEDYWYQRNTDCFERLR